MLMGNHGLYRHGATFGSSWTPAALGSALALWLDADDASTITLNGSTVSQWNDKSGNARNASQATAVNQPTYSATGLNGKPTLTFDGLNDNLQATIPSLANQNNISFFGVTQILTRRYSVFLGSGMSGSGGTTGIRWGLFGQGNLTSDGIGWAGPASDLSLGNGSLLPINTPYQAVYTKTPTQWQILLNGSTISTVNDTSFPTSTYSLTIGAEKEGSYQSNALASEIIIIGGILSTTNRQLLEGYFAWKWGLVSSLPYTHPYRWDGRVFGGVQLWRPSNLGSTLALWLDAEDAASITLNGSTVSQWNDKSGNARNVLQATAANQPTRTASGLNGKPVLTFDGTDWLFNANPGALLRNVAGGTVAAVMNYTNFTIQRIPIAAMNGTGAGVRLSTILQAAGTLNIAARRLDAEGALVVSTPPTYTNGTNVIQVGVARYSDGALDQFVNGVAGGTGSFPSSGNSSDTDSATIIIGGTSTDDGVTLNSNQMLGFVGEVVYTNTALSTNDRQRLEGYFAWKWGLQNSLPVGHPFRLIPPSL
jgi:hypothetical protein